MPRKTYPLEYRQRLVELVRAGQSPEGLLREYEPSAKTIREWVERADAIDRGKGGLTEAAKDRRIRELEQQLEIEREEKEILKKPSSGGQTCGPETRDLIGRRSLWERPSSFW